jgi:hypothetical protein
MELVIERAKLLPHEVTGRLGGDILHLIDKYLVLIAALEERIREIDAGEGIPRVSSSPI